MMAWHFMSSLNFSEKKRIGKKLIMSSAMDLLLVRINPCPAESGYTLTLQTVWIQISWFLKKPTDLDLHCLPLNM